MGLEHIASAFMEPTSGITVRLIQRSNWKELSIIKSPFMGVWKTETVAVRPATLALGPSLDR